jgi:nitronate monooxygenase
MRPAEIIAWTKEFRAKSDGQFQINLWIPDPPPHRDAELEKAQREFLEAWGPPVPHDAGDTLLPDFAAQFEAMLQARPKVISSIMGLYSPTFIAELKAHGIIWFATVTTVAEARAAEAAGADAVVAQGMEAGGHRGAFDADLAERQMVGLISLLPQVVDAVNVPVIATGGIGDARAVAAALMLGASAVQIGTCFLRSPEAMTPPPYADRLAMTESDQTIVTRAFSGRPGRSVATAYVRAALNSPSPAPYPVQRGLTKAMRESARQAGDTERMQMWAGQAAKFAKAEPAGNIARTLWDGAVQLLKEAGGL